MSGRITLNLDRGTDFRLDVSFEIPDKGHHGALRTLGLRQDHRAAMHGGP